MPIETNEAKTNTETDGHLERLVMPDYTQGVCQDGAAILRDGLPLNIEGILYCLREGEKAAHKAYHADQLIDEINTVCWDEIGRGFKQVDASKILAAIERYESLET